MTVRATVLIPTTGDRGPLLDYSIPSVLAQSVREIELFIIGDGVTEGTRQTIAGYQGKDPRVQFFDHPKHRRRGEPHRHAALSERARGEIICYLCDRDFMLPNHVATMMQLLEGADFGHTLRFSIRPGDEIRLMRPIDLAHEADRRLQLRLRVTGDGLPLSFVGHRLSMYKKLPFGWRTTPRVHFTDGYMWAQFLAQPDCRAASSYEPTILYFPRGQHPGWPVEQRLNELKRWHQKMQDPAWSEALHKELSAKIVADWTLVTRRERQRLTTRLAHEKTYWRRWVRRSMGR